MSKPFIKVRFDRMHNDEFGILCMNILKTIEKSEFSTLGLEDTFSNFKGRIEPLLKLLEAKERKMPQSDSIIELRKRLNELVTALLLYVKSLERAAFSEQAESIKHCSVFIRFNFKKFVHEGVFTQNGLLDNLNKILNQNEEMKKSCEQLGIMRFVEEISVTRKKIKELENDRTKTKLSQPKAGAALTAKEQLISELKYMFIYIERQMLTKPQTNYSALAGLINTYLIEARAQLRNLATRRKTAKAKAEKKKKSDNTESLESL